MLRKIIALSAFVILAGCSSNPHYAKLPLLPTDTAPVAPVAQELDDYKLRVGDVVELKFYLNPEFDETVTVRPDGMISTKVVDGLQVYNKTIEDVTKEIKKLYKKELKDPKVTTTVRSFAPIRIYVSGEVNAPGEFIVVGQPLTLTQAVARAGGIKNSADERHVIVIRRGEGETSQIFRADYDAATEGADPLMDARLAAYDVVYVPRSGVARFYRGYQQYIQQFISPSIGASYSLNNNN